jgi:hypothetical protein
MGARSTVENDGGVTPLSSRRDDGGSSRKRRARAARRRIRTPSFATHIFTGLGDDDLDSPRSAHAVRRDVVMFDFGGVVDGYCSDFGRTIYCGRPPRRLPRGLRRHARRAGAGLPRRRGTPALRR